MLSNIHYRDGPHVRYGQNMGHYVIVKFIQISLLLLLAILAVGGRHVTTHNDSQSILLSPLPFDAGRPEIDKIGSLRFLNAWELRSNNPSFGGLSALAHMVDGKFIAVGDAGMLVMFHLHGAGIISQTSIRPLAGAYDAKMTFRDRDSEGLTHDPVTGRYWISYEAKHGVRRFDPSLRHVDGVVRPAEMQNWPENGGGEAIIRLPDGRFIIFSEQMGGEDGFYDALIFSGDPVDPGTNVSGFKYHPPKGFHVTDAKMLPDGRMIILQRAVSLPGGFTAALSILDPADIKPGYLVTGKMIALLQPPLLVDNMEGLAVSKEGGATIIWLISDDNFFALQRTLLMKFMLDEGVKKPEAEATPGFESL